MLTRFLFRAGIARAWPNLHQAWTAALDTH